MSDDLKQQIIEDLMKDFPTIENIEETEDGLIIKADTDTLWNVFEVLYSGLDNVELNLDKKEDAHIIIKI